MPDQPFETLLTSLSLNSLHSKFKGFFLKWNKVKTSSKGFSASKCDVGNWILSKSWEFFEKLFGNFMVFLGSLLRIFWQFFGNFCEEFLGGIFWEELFGKKFLEKKFRGGFFRRTILGGKIYKPRDIMARIRYITVFLWISKFTITSLPSNEGPAVCSSCK